MRNSICRAFTLVNYHIPLTKNDDLSVPYITLGFFDGMFTERLHTCYGDTDLKDLWKYTIKRTQQNKGKYSCQHIFGFSCDEWNQFTDEEFWGEQAERENPLVFVVLLQIEQYMSGLSGAKTIEEQCREFNNRLNNYFETQGMYHVYGTVDRNDYIVCIRGRNHKTLVESIKLLHDIQENVVHSYSILSIKREILEVIDHEEYKDIYNEKIDSICLKGIANSSKLQCDIPLDRRYYDFCKRLIERIYPNGEEDNKIYDILGDDDFRLIARNVSLGALLKEFASDGMLGYENDEFRFYFFSSSLILNTLTKPQNGVLSEEEKKVLSNIENVKVCSPICDELLQNIPMIKNVVDSWDTDVYNDKILTFCQALWQLLQSLKVLEMAPTKKYDFYSLYPPFSALVRILEEKLIEQMDGNRKDLEEEQEIYDYIHKISTTLHGSFRTDIQFFQVRDFNVIDYTPAKLRAFYSYWTFEIANFYNLFSDDPHKYSFILSPGMFRGVNVKQLFVDANEKERLMLITTPERLIFSPKWMLLVIGHEVSHFVGTELRGRRIRQWTWLKALARIIQLEWICLVSEMIPGKWKEDCIEVLSSADEFLNVFFTGLQEMMKQGEQLDYHKEVSKKRIKETLRNYEDTRLEKLVYDHAAKFRNKMVEKLKGKKKLQKDDEIEINMFCQDLIHQLRKLYEKFEYTVADDILEILHYYASESQADIIAILSIGISPKMYIQSFVKSENIHDIQNAEGETCMSVARIGIVLKVVQEIVEQEKDWLIQMDKDFVDNWSGDIAQCTRQAFNIESVEYKLATLAFGYLINIINYQSNIEQYKRLYNEKYENQAFSNTVISFMCDRYVFNEVCKYGQTCASHYINQLKKDVTLLNKKKSLQNTYRKIAGDSILEAMQEMESFLDKCETLPFSSA